MINKYARYGYGDMIGETRERGFFENVGTALAYQFSPIITRTEEEYFFGDQEADPNFDWRDNVQGYESYSIELRRAKNKTHMEFIKSHIDQSNKRREKLYDLPWYAPSQFVAAVFDPANILLPIPVMGVGKQLARGAISLGDAAKTTATAGFTVGAASEAYRAPFDPAATREEVFANVLTSTALATTIGSFPTAVRGMSGAINKSIDKSRQLAGYKGTFNGKYEDITVRESANINDIIEKSKQRRDELEAEGLPQTVDQLRLADVDDVPVTYNKKNKEIFVNMEKIYDDFNNKVFAKQEGDIPPIKEGTFLSANEYAEFLVHKEVLKAQQKRKPKESKDLYEARIQVDALERFNEGYQVNNSFANSPFFQFISTPGKRIMKKGGPLAQRIYQRIEGVAQFASKRNTVGLGSQSMRQRMAMHEGEGAAMLQKLREIYDKAQGGYSDVEGMAFDKARAVISSKITFDEFVETKMREYIRLSEGWDSVNRYGDVTDLDKEAYEIMRNYFRYYRQYAEDLDIFRSSKTMDERIANLNDKIAQREKRIASLNEQSEARGLTDKQLKLLEKDEAILARHKEELEFEEIMRANGVDREDFYFPIYYRKKDMLADENLRQEFIDVIAAHMRENPKPFVWDAKQGKMVERTSDFDPDKVAISIVDNMLMKDADQQDFRGLPGGKHIAFRSLDIPEWKVERFMIVKPEVIFTYARRMGARLEHVRSLGKDSIDDILDEIEYEGIQRGLSDDDIAGLRSDMLGEYERVTGTLIKDPDAMSQQVVKAMKDITGMTFLGQAGIASVTDMGSVILEHGMGKTFQGALGKRLTTGFAKSAKEIQKYTVGTGIMLNGAQRRMVGDSITQLEPNAVERVFNPITQAFYNIPLLGNNLGFVTRYGKITDATLRMDKFLDMSRRYDDLDAADIEYLARHGIDKPTAKYFAKQDIFNEDGFLFANTDSWDVTTTEGREMLRRWKTAMNTGVGNTIIMATNYDKPLMMDGVMYVRHRPWMDRTKGWSIDERASTANVKMVRVESGVMTMPWQFMNFTIGATSRITGAMLDPQRKYRMQAGFALLALGYFSLQLKKEDWWFEKRSNSEIFMRSLDASGLLGVYSDIGYMALHMAIGSGIYDQEQGIIQGKYKPTPFTAFAEPFGAAPGLFADYFFGLKDLLDGGSTEEAERLKYLIPFWPMFGLRDEAQDWAGSIISGN